MEMIPYEELLADLDSAVEWLSTLGISKPNRIRQHQSNIRMLVDAQKAGRFDDLRKELEPEKLKEIFWSWAEAFEFVDVATSLRSVNPVELLPVLQRAVEGPVDASREKAENSSTQGRNIMFELVIAARLVRAGLKTYLREPDVVADMDDWRLLIACKRPLREAGIDQNVTAARQQLRRALHTERNQKSLGVIALSISKILNPGNKILEINQRSDLREALSEHVAAIWHKHKTAFSSPSEAQISGAMIHLVTPASITDEKVFLTAAATHVYGFRGSNEKRELLKYLERLMRTTALQEQRK